MSTQPKYPFDKKADGPVEIDGSFGEGGGQILRTALSLSCITGTPVRIRNIRAGRAAPGLKPQHLLSAGAAARISGGLLKGAEPGSMTIEFSPGPVRPGEYAFDVSEKKASAGSTGLVFQTIAPPLFLASGPSSLVIRGGTHVEWSPPADYIKEVFLPVVKTMGVAAEFSNSLRGYYPMGGGQVEAAIRPASLPLKPLSLTERGVLKRVSLLSAVSNLPRAIAERQLARAGARLGAKGLPALEGSAVEVPSPGKGTYVFILAEFEKVRAGFSALGARGKRAEDVADQAAEGLIEYLGRSGALDAHLSDQVLLFMALAQGTSEVTVSEVTNHLVTNIHVIERLLPVSFNLRGTRGKEGRISVKGCGLV